jgi:hypothetical protein
MFAHGAFPPLAGAGEGLVNAVRKAKRFKP